MAKQCQICGNNSGMYPLCVEHFRMRDEGLVEKCEQCGKWFLTEKGCECQTPKFTDLPLEGFDSCVICGSPTNGKAFCYTCWKEHTEEEMLAILNSGKYYDPEVKKPQEAGPNNVPVAIDIETDAIPEVNAEEIPSVEKRKPIVVDPQHRSKCIICGFQTDGLLFCTTCYSKYCEKELLIKITHCREIDLLDAEYEGRYTCKDGHVVKSKSEREIDNYLFEHGIAHAYEHELSYGAQATEVLHPDFYLLDYFGKGRHLYIEHWGYDERNLHYTKTKKFKMQKYRELGITLVCTFEKTDMGRIDSVLDRKLKPANIREGQINFDD